MVGGDATVGTVTVTCQEACEDDCCVGDDGRGGNSCKGFNGKDCKDGVSCSDTRTTGSLLGSARRPSCV